ncbi:conserved hypothetical protein [Neospora caninum Liverpool]|uniref:Transmembrane protein n=1 Tax=Neospora caninum (strain Liverpool) TaxID=572307 RepID=F0VF34_NEOCL|nr:conserved hypothetical protein [Neospora caninum Liverpool]CBZ52328.1 conserved hypothetical protein [Neospora caninum Liverpool]|eukprot:XP_003882360.1 conserved hypothetical protein [Neospora caninum Liverpool]
MAELSRTPDALADSVSHEIQGDLGQSSVAAVNLPDDRELARTSGGGQDVRLLIHSATHSSASPQSNALGSHDEQRYHLLPLPEREKSSRLGPTSHMILVTVFVLLAAVILLIASCALAGRARWKHSVLLTHCLLELHIAVVLLFLVIGPAATLLWRFCRDEATPPRQASCPPRSFTSYLRSVVRVSEKAERRERVTSVIISSFEISTAFAFLFVVVHILYLPPLSAFDGTGHQDYWPTSLSAASVPWSTSFISISSPSFNALYDVGRGEERVKHPIGATHGREAATDQNSPDPLSHGSVSGLSDGTPPAAKTLHVTARKSDTRRMEHRRIPYYSEHMGGLMHRHEELFRQGKQLLSSSQESRARDLPNLRLSSYPEDNFHPQLRVTGRGSRKSSKTAQVAHSQSSPQRWKATPSPERPGSRRGGSLRSGPAHTAGTRDSRQSERTTNHRHDAESVSFVESLVSKAVENVLSHPAGWNQLETELSRDVATKSWLLTMKTIILIGTVSWVIFMAVSGVLTRINRSLKSQAAR